MPMPIVSIQLELSGRELDVILAALRLYEHLLTIRSTATWRVDWIPRDRQTPVTAEEVSTLCGRIN